MGGAGRFEEVQLNHTFCFSQRTAGTMNWDRAASCQSVAAHGVLPPGKGGGGGAGGEGVGVPV